MAAQLAGINEIGNSPLPPPEKETQKIEHFEIS